MTKIHHSEEYVKAAAQSSGADVKNLTHSQIAAYKATPKQIEADMLIEIAFAKSKTSVEDIDVSVFKPCTKVY